MNAIHDEENTEQRLPAITLAIAWLAIKLLGLWAILTWRCRSQAECAWCGRVTRRAWFPIGHLHRTHTICRGCFEQQTAAPAEAGQPPRPLQRSDATLL